MKKLLLLSAFMFLGITLAGCFHNKATNQQTATSTTSEGTQFNFANPKKSAHYESNTPEHGSILAGVPTNVVIDVNFDLAAPSEITINKDGTDYGVGKTAIDENKLALRRGMNSTAPDGVYTVNYKACWPDGSCHEGSFQFAIDRKESANFQNMTAQAQVTIDMKNIAFTAQDVRVSKETRVTWTNSDSVSHYVNTDAHPSHTYQADKNSEELRQGDSYTYTFKNAGIYPYHCSAHAGTMTANILVE